VNPAEIQVRRDAKGQIVSATRASDGAPVIYDGLGTIETYTVSHARDGQAEGAFLAIRTPDGARAWAASTDRDVMDALETDELLGRPVTVLRGEARV